MLFVEDQPFFFTCSPEILSDLALQPDINGGYKDHIEQALMQVQRLNWCPMGRLPLLLVLAPCLKDPLSSPQGPHFRPASTEVYYPNKHCCQLQHAIMPRRAFSVVGPSAWNDSPVKLHSLLMTFSSEFYISLKSFFFCHDWAGSASEK